jgi:hypothetical protein
MKRLIATLIIGLTIAFQASAIVKQQLSSPLPTPQDLVIAINALSVDRTDVFDTLPQMASCDLNQGVNGWTPLSIALHKRFVLVAEDLIAHGASLYEALKRAIEHNNIKALSLVAFTLTHNGVSISDLELDREGHTPFSYAIALDKEKSAQRLFNNHGALVFDSVRLALEATNTTLINQLHQRVAAETDRSIRVLLQNALATNDAVFLTKIRTTLDPMTINDYLNDLTETHQEIFNSPEAQAFYTSVSREIAIDTALSMNDYTELSTIIQEAPENTFDLQALLAQALERGANNIIIWLCTHEVFIPFKELPALVNNRNSNAMYTYIDLFFENIAQKRAQDEMAEEPETDIYAILVALYRRALDLKLPMIENICTRYATPYIKTFIELDDVERVKEAFTSFNEELVSGQFLKHALIHNATQTAEWLVTERNTSMPFYAYLTAINQDNAVIIQKYFARELAAFTCDSLTKNELTYILSDIERDLLEKIQDLPEGEARLSWHTFYHEKVQPVVNTIRDLLGY